MSAIRTGSTQSGKVALFAAAGALVLLIVAVWFLVVSPKRSEAADLRADIAAAKEELAARRADSTSAPAGPGRVSASEARTLMKAMPDTSQMSDLLRQLDKLARRAGVTLDTITPQPETGGAGYRSVPLTIVVEGRFFGIQRFLSLLRKQVQVRDGRVQSKGRLVDVQAVDLQQDEGAASRIRATLTVQAFVFAGGAQAATPASAVGAS